MGIGDDNTPDESGGRKATIDANTTISDGSDYGDEPPRILMGINDAPVQAPDGAVFKDGEIVKHELEGSFDTDKLLTVLKTVRKRLADDYGQVYRLELAVLPVHARQLQQSIHHLAHPVGARIHAL